MLMSTLIKKSTAEELERFGPMIKVIISNPENSSEEYEGLALVDTGGTRSQIEASYFDKLKPQRLNLVVANNSSIQGAIKETYKVHLKFPELNKEGDFEVTFATMTATKANRADAVITVLGRDFLSKCKFTYMGTGEYQIELLSN